MSGARQGRRRRILQEEVLSASRELAAYSPDDAAKADGGEGRRYAFDEGSLGGALAKRHFPSRAIAPAGLIAAGIGVVAGVGVLHHYRHALAARLGDSAGAFFDVAQSTSLATWLTAATMLTVAFLSAMVLAVRRRRVDDYRGRHRLWRGAFIAATLLSLDAVTNLHSVAAVAASNAVGMRLLAGGAEWWLALGTLILGWVGMRVLLDIKESKLAFVALLAAVVAGGVAIVGPMAGVGGQAAAEIAKLAQLSSYLLVAVALVSYMRFLHHDVAAGVATKPQKSRPAGVKVATDTIPAETDRSKVADAPAKAAKQERRKAQKAKAAEVSAESDARWTDGSDGYAESYDDDSQPRKLSKSERKRLRKQKANRRAA